MATMMSHLSTSLRVEPYWTRAAAFGPENPLPPLECTKTVHVDPDDKAHQARHEGLRVNYGRGGTLLPYRMQDQYSRKVRRQRFTAVVLENDILRATFIPSFGGRLWSLFNKPTGRELLDVNPVIRVANLAFRNAWFAGGVEWNLCPLGCHTPLTASTLFTGILQLDDGTPVLRFWEWERRRQLAYQLDVWLPAGSPYLRVRFRVHNGHAATVPVYQWSNIAVPETPDTRVIVPADRAFINIYDEKGIHTTRDAIPMYNGKDISYAVNSEAARDYFFDVRRRQPWIAALRGDGRGLVQTSTSRQVGRKLFVWGMCPGGRRWQTYLSEPEHNYIEIQAGLGKTQLESVPMPAHATWEWLEAYGLMEADAAISHGDNWRAAGRHVESRLQAALPGAQLEAELAATRAMASRPTTRTVVRGSGWGALEQRRGDRGGSAFTWAPGLRFDEASMGDDQAPWLILLETGTLPARKPTETPGAFQESAAWRRLLQRSITRGDSDHWLGWFHLGLMRYSATGAHGPATRAWERSVALTPNPWALRCLAGLARYDGNLLRAAVLYRRAHRLLPRNTDLAAEAAETLRLAGKPREALRLVASLSPAARRHDRVRIAQAWSLLEIGDHRGAMRVITTGPEYASIREGEVALSTLWFRAHDLRVAQAEKVPVTRALRTRVRRENPPPPALDMRMLVEAPEKESFREMRNDARLAALRRRAAARARARAKTRMPQTK